jgi:hypothetical protein
MVFIKSQLQSDLPLDNTLLYMRELYTFISVFYCYILRQSFSHSPATGDNQKRKMEVVTFTYIGNEINNITKLFRKLDT